MRSLFVALLAVLLFAVPVMAINSVEDVTAGPGNFIAPTPGPVWQPSRAILFDNGPFVTDPGAGYGGADVSRVQSSLGMSVYGFGCQQVSSIIVADDFTIPASETWNIQSFTFFNYQTNSGTTSTITGVFIELFDTDPSLGGTPIWGDLTTNRMDVGGSLWSNCYRALETDPLNTARPIMATVCTVPMTLNAGHYWLAWQETGSLSSGPWNPPVTILGNTTTGDALQSVSGTWAYIVDSGTQTQQGLPFVIQGEIGGTPTEHSTWGAIKSLFR